MIMKAKTDTPRSTGIERSILLMMYFSNIFPSLKIKGGSG
jgi:hypothetical protein